MVAAIVAPTTLAAVAYCRAQAPSDLIREDLIGRGLPPEIDVDSMVLDIQAIERVETVLAAPAPAEAARRLLHQEHVGGFLERDVISWRGRTVGVGIECRVDFEYASDHSDSFHSATCSGFRLSNKSALRHYLRFTRLLRPAHGQLEAGNVAGRRDETGDRARWAVLGPVPRVSVPTLLAKSYDLLTDRNAMLGFGSSRGCGGGHEAAQILLYGGRVDLLRAAMKEANPGGRVHAALALIENYPLTPEDQRVIHALPKLTPRLWSCGGCTSNLVDVRELLHAQLASRSAAADLGILPFGPRRVVRPGMESAESLLPDPPSDQMTDRSWLRVFVYEGRVQREPD